MGKTVGDVMTSEVVTLRPGMSLTEMDRVLTQEGISGAPVVEHGALVGVVSQSDVIRTLYADQVESERVSGFYGSPYPISIPDLERLSRDSRKIADHMIRCRVEEIMTRDPKTAHPADTLQSAAERMVKGGIHRLPVTEDGRLVGMLSALDVVAVVADAGVRGASA